MRNRIFLLFVCFLSTVVTRASETGTETIRCVHGAVQAPVTISKPVPACTGCLHSGCDVGPLRIGTSDATSLTLATNGCSNRIVIDAQGAVVVMMPSAGEALTVNGNIVIPLVNIPQTQGILKLGGTGAQRINVYESGISNFFAGSGPVNTVITGTNNIVIGTTANAALTIANNTIAIGTSTVATGTDSISIGNGANSTVQRTIVIGSTDSANTGAAPTATALNAIVIGSARGTQPGALATGLASIAVGGSDGVFPGAAATAPRSIAIGMSAVSSSTLSIAIGSASGVTGGNGPTASNMNAIAIGSANNAQRGALASGIAAVAVGGSDGVFPGATATGDRSIAIGMSAVASTTLTIAVGSASGTAGGIGPTASNTNTIAIGSAIGSQRGAFSNGIASIAIGGSDGVFPGAAATGDRSIAIGMSAVSTGSVSITLGSASGIAGGNGPLASAAAAIAIGSANGALAGPIASGLASVALGGSDGTSPGAIASGARSVALGCGANVAQDDAILLGNVVTTSVRVAIGIAAPAAKLDIVGVNATPVLRFDQVTTSTVNAPIWLHPSNSPSNVGATPIHFNASGQWFGFTSSLRYKTNVREITDESSVIYALNPVIYDAREGYGEGTDIPGFIAEEVYEVAPNIVVLNGDKQPENVAYNCLHALAIRELQRQQQKMAEHKAAINDQKKKMKRLLSAIIRLRKKLLELQDEHAK